MLYGLSFVWFFEFPVPPQISSMIRAEYKDKERIVEILTNSFQDNKSVNYILKQDQKRVQRIRNLMAYSFDFCDVFLSSTLKTYRGMKSLVSEFTTN